jgi:DNA-binding NarL/FixJ family response regulator
LRVTLLLVVEDEDLRLFIELVLRQDPRFEVLGVKSTPLAALQLCDVVEPAMIILDDGRGSGASTSDVLPRLLSRCPRSKVLLFSSVDRPSAAELAGVDCVVRKDNIVRILGVVQEVLGLDGAAGREAG